LNLAFFDTVALFATPAFFVRGDFLERFAAGTLTGPISSDVDGTGGMDFNDNRKE
jgi:hypothetical protein